MNRRFMLVVAAALVIGACNDQQEPSSNVADPASLAVGKNTPKYVISFSSAKAGDVSAAITKAGGQVRRVSQGAGLATAYSADPDFASRLLAAPGIRRVTQDMVVRWIDPNERGIKATSDMTPPKATAGRGIGDNEGFFAYQWAPKSIHAPEAWELGARGTGVRVAVLDGGINNNHLDLKNNVDVARSASMVDGFAFNQEVDPDGFSHATHVGGIIAAQDNSKGTIGVAPGATLIGVKVLHEGSGSWGDVIDGILYAATPIAKGGAGAHVINMSLGATFPSGADANVLALAADMNEATTFAYDQGVVVIASAGNGDRLGRGIDHDQGQYLTLPAQAAHVLAVSATAPERFILGGTNFTKLASYSNFGTSIIDFGGPGGDFDSDPDPNIYVFDMVLSPGTIYPEKDGYFFAAGTSMSAPAAAGVAALIVEKMGLVRDPDAVEQKLRSSSDDLPPTGLDKAYGYGFVNAQNAVR
jgi:lantibiotic leader peptide-processing serine protease